MYIDNDRSSMRSIIGTPGCIWLDNYVSQEMPVARFRLYGSPCLDVGQTVPVPVPDYAAFAIGWLVAQEISLFSTIPIAEVGKGQPSGRDV